MHLQPAQQRRPLEESSMKNLKLKYQLSEKEYEEALLCLDWKKEGKARNINMAIVTILGILVLIVYIMDPGRFYCLILLAVIIIVLFAMAYSPRHKRKKRAKELARQKGTFMVEFLDHSLRYGHSSTEVSPIKGESQLLRSENLCVLKLGNEVFIIPKRILKPGEERQIREWAQALGVETINIRIKDGKDESE